jgi:hypothetical protein
MTDAERRDLERYLVAFDDDEPTSVRCQQCGRECGTYREDGRRCVWMHTPLDDGLAFSVCAGSGQEVYDGAKMVDIQGM